MSIKKFTEDFKRFGFTTKIDGKKIELDYEDLQFYIEIDEAWEKAINKVYRAKQYTIDNESKFQVSNSSIEFQIFKLTPSGSASKPDTLELFLEPGASDLLTNGDNLCAAPWGDLFVCEDLISEHKEKTPHIRGVTPEGKIYNFARNAMNKSEFAGTCFTPDGSILFVNMQGCGLTVAIRGPWNA